MDVNTTCIPNHNTTDCSSPGPQTGLAVGLPVFFILLVLGIVAAYLSYRQFEKLRRVLSFGSRRRIEKEREVSGEAPQTVKEIHEYDCGPEPHNPPAPIYENVSRAPSRPVAQAAKLRRSAPQSEEDDEVYLQCDAIYSNDPACNPPHDHQEDDIYIIPDS